MRDGRENIAAQKIAELENLLDIEEVSEIASQTFRSYRYSVDDNGFSHLLAVWVDGLDEPSYIIDNLDH